MNICVTGGAGFIGSHLVDKLILLGHNVVVIDSLVTGNLNFVSNNAKFIKMDIRDRCIVDIFRKYNIEYVFHEAAQTMVNQSMINPKYDCDVNLVGLLNILDACRENKVKKILMPSSAAVYGNCESLPLRERDYGEPTSFYGISKLTSEKYLELYYKQFGLPYICYRYSNVYGARQGSGGEGGVISIFCQQLIKNQHIQVFGDGNQTRDFIHIDDVVSANLLGLKADSITGIFNISTNISSSINDLINILLLISNNEIIIDYKERYTGDILHSRLDNQKMKDLFGWCPQILLKDGLKKTYQYFLDNQVDI